LKVSVTGASGFLGSAVLRKLKEKGVDATGYTASERPNLVKLESYEDVPEGDCLIHLAENSNRGEVNALGTEYHKASVQTCRALTSGRFSKVIYASSAVLYGDKAQTPRRETDPVVANDTYSETKLACEQLVVEAKNNWVARLSNLYGSGMSGGTVFEDVLNQLRGALPIRVRNLAPVRDFLWCDDAADAIVIMAMSKTAGETINIGSGYGTSIHELVKSILFAANEADRPVASMSTGSNVPSVLVLNVARAKNVLNWAPSVSIESGTRKLVSEFLKLE
jgi:UDP-glucose 4-epimerase